MGDQFNSGILLGFTILRTTGDKLMKIGQYEKAIKQYTKAYNTKKDVRCLLNRSMCHLQLGSTMNALYDAELAIACDRTSHMALLCKAEALFHSGDFENALVFYYRGRRLRPDIQEFSVGIQKASEAILNCIGTPDTVKLTLKGDLSHFSDPGEKLRKTLLEQSQSARKVLSRKKFASTTKTNKKVMHHLLGPLFKDHQVLDSMLKDTVAKEEDPSLISVSEAKESPSSGKRVCDISDDALKYLNSRAQFWRSQKPIYSRVYDKKLFKRAYGPRKLKEAVIMDTMEKIVNDLEAGNYHQVLWAGRKCLEKLKVTKLPSKPVFQGQLHSAMGSAYFNLGQYLEAMLHHRKDLALAKDLKIKEALARSKDNIGKVHVMLEDYESAVKIWEERLKEVEDEDEGLWISQELCKCYFRMHQPEIALFYARTALEPSAVPDNLRWVLHGNVLAGQCKVDMKEFEESLNYFNSALKIAEELSDSEAVEQIQDIKANVVTQMKKRATLNVVDTDPKTQGKGKIEA